MKHFFITALLLSVINLEGATRDQSLYTLGPRQEKSWFKSNKLAQISPTNQEGELSKTYALQAESAIIFRDRTNPSKFFINLKNVSSEVLYFVSRTKAGRISLKGFLQDGSSKSKMISSFSSIIQQQSFEPSENITVALSNLKWNAADKTMTLDAWSSKQDELLEGTYLKPLFFIRF